MNKHKTIIHTRCPFAPTWDYYLLTIETKNFLQCEILQAICDDVRGKEMTQEQVFMFFRKNINISSDAAITLSGRHGQNGRLVIHG